MARFKVNDIDNERFYQIPKALFTNEKYKGIGNDAKVMYALLKDRMILSRKSGWIEGNGDIYLLFKQEELSEMLDISLSSVKRALNKLKEYNLIDIVRQGLNIPNKIYINKVDTTEFRTGQIELSRELNSDIQTGQIEPSEQVKMNHLDRSNWTPNDTDIKDTEYKETEKSIRTAQPKHHFAEFVTMTNDEYSSLIEKLGNEKSAKDCIQILDDYKAAHGKKYKSDYRAILNWVINAYNERQHRRCEPSGENPQMAMARQAMEMIANGS